MSKNKIADYLQEKARGKNQNLSAWKNSCETAKNNTVVSLYFKFRIP